MIDEKLINKPRTLRCTGYELEYLKHMLKTFRGQCKSETVPTTDVVISKDVIVAGEPGTVSRVGISVEEFLAKKGVVSPAEQMPMNNAEEPEVDYTEWNTDQTMREIDRGCCYETDGFGYPDEADRFSRKYPAIWQKLYNAKLSNQTARYNEIMYTEVWEIVKNGRF